VDDDQGGDEYGDDGEDDDVGGADDVGDKRHDEEDVTDEDDEYKDVPEDDDVSGDEDDKPGDKSSKLFSSGDSSANMTMEDIMKESERITAEMEEEEEAISMVEASERVQAARKAGLVLPPELLDDDSIGSEQVCFYFYICSVLFKIIKSFRDICHINTYLHFLLRLRYLM